MSKNTKYEMLTPCCDADDDGYYSEALNSALDDKKVTNIAISGSFGSGKSSFLRTFEKNNRKWNYLNISLATFKNEEKESPEHNQAIERSILQQIFYRVKKQDIPRSKFKRTHSLSSKETKKLFIFSILWLISAILIFKPEIAKSILFFNGLNLLDFIYYSKLKGLYSSLILIIFSATSSYFFCQAFCFLIHMKITKLKLSENIEVDKNDSTSILNEHIDEILYFFEETKFNIVVIEDLDRFKNTDIFIKLREINHLINKSDAIGRVIFIYAVKDDMFQDGGRTKFFDFIVPIIPFINSSNSYEKLIERFGADYFDKALMNYVSLYIDDMRLLINICNEYDLYHNNLLSVGLDKNKLFAMIVYKNLEPKDFSDLHYNTGVLYGIFKDKPKYIQGIIPKIDKKITILKEKIRNIEEEAIDKVKELRSIYLFEIIHLCSEDRKIQQLALGSQFIKIYDEEISLKEIEKDEFFSKLIDSSFDIKDGRGYYYNNTTNFSEIENRVNSKFSYTEREQFIKNKTSNKSQQLKEEVEALEYKKNQIRAYTLKEISGDSDINSKFSEALKEHDFLKFLIKKNYLNEDYYTYISYFFEASITKTDKTFLLSVANEKPLDFNYKLFKTAELLDKTNNRDFSNSAILNNSLIDYLLENKEKYQEQVKILMDQLANETDDSKQFIIQYFEITKNKIQLIENLVKNWDKLWRYLDQESGFSNKKKDEYLYLILKYCEISDIVKLNHEELLTNYINQKNDFISFQNEIDNKKIYSILEGLTIEFSNLESLDYHHLDISNHIYENQYYKINIHMINCIVFFILDPHNENKSLIETLNKSHLTTIKENRKKLHILVDYIDENIEKYIENILLKITSNINESEKTVIELLNDQDIDQELQFQIINKEQVTFKDISKVSKIFFGTLLEQEKIECCWENLLYYYQRVNEFDNSLINYLNKEINYKILSQMNPNEQSFDSIILEQFFDALLLQNDLTDDAYQLLLNINPFHDYVRLNISDLSSIKIDALLAHNISTEAKQRLIESLDLTIIEAEEKLLQSIYDFYLVNNFDMGEDLLKILIAVERDNIEDKVGLLSSQIGFLTEESISEFLNQIGKPYCLIADKNKSLDIKKTNVNEELLKKLKNSQYISSYEIKGKKFQVFQKK